MKKAYDFDDVLIKPIASKVCSRDMVDISVRLSDNLKIEFPLITSPMVGVVDGKFAKKLSKLGGMAILHRFYRTIVDLKEDIIINNLKDEIYGVSVRIGELRYPEILDYNPSVILVDTANGYTDKLLKYCLNIADFISNNNYKTLIMAGNVATAEGIYNLRNSGCHLVRVGIGGGSPCSTRNKTGIGVPNISALLDFQRNKEKEEFPKIVIDGGIKNSGDLVKAIVAGADLGMAGKLFAECYEAPNEGVIYGMASRTHMENTKINIKSVEGFDTIINKKQSLEQFVKEFGYGIKSAGTYLNAKNLREIYYNGEFLEVTGNAIKKDIEKYE